ncbi:MAG TPA: hypothetical protein VFM91_09440 [Propionibacteriaceae bacterium]|nr:hypothetical protein [Propionibacteriaceae bacterium]
MLFTAATLRGLTEGRVNCTYRRWEVVRPKVGSRFTTAAGIVEVTSIAAADEMQLTEQDAADAGFDSVAALVKWTSAKGQGDLYRVGIVLAGADPRVALRDSDKLAAADVSVLNARLQRMDRAAEQPWTHETLRQIRRQPGVVSTELAAEAGQERQAYKLRVRRLKALGLTESLERGYRLSPRGQAYLERLDAAERDEGGT